jgi:hypothetical protein
MTNHLEGASSGVQHRQEQLELVHRRFWPDREPDRSQQTSGNRLPPRLEDLELVRKASKMRGEAGEKFRRLWAGDTAGYSSPSEADLALTNYLAFFAGPDEDAIANLFAQSGLYRSKWNRDDYRHRTVQKALEGRTEFYDPIKRNARRNGRTAQAAPRNGTHGEIPATDGPAPVLVHLTDLGNARRLVGRHGEDLRHCFLWRKWCCWDGIRWRVDDTAATTRRIKDTICELFDKAQQQIAAIRKELEAK